MKNKIFVKMLATFTLFFITLTAFADKGFKVESENTNSVKLTWDKDDKTTYYQINYGTDPSNKASETEAMESNNFEITGLETGKKYYFTLVGLDSSGTETFKSKDLEFTLSGNNIKNESFALKTLELKEKNILRASFSKNIDSSKINQVEFKIEAIEDISDYLKVKNISPVSGDSKSVDIEFDGEPTEGTVYKVVVLAIFDESGNNIKFGVDSEGKFKGGELNKIVERSNENEFDLNSAGPTEEPTKVEETKKEEIKKEEIKKVEEKTEKKVLKGESGVSENVGKNVEKMSENKENLPQTGPEIILLLLLALLIPAGIYKFKN